MEDTTVDEKSKVEEEKSQEGDDDDPEMVRWYSRI